MVDAADLKSASRKGVWVRVPPSALNCLMYAMISMLVCVGFERILQKGSHMFCRELTVDEF
jgi:hypothetical protein